MSRQTSFVKPSLLFVAGVPSSVDKQGVIDFFAKYGRLTLASKDSLARGKMMDGKGYCILECPESRVANQLVNRKYFQFLLRTLTVTYFVTGRELII